LRLLRLWDDPDIWPRRFPALRITLLRLFVRHRASDDNILPGQPVDRGGYLVLCSQLQRVNHPQHFIEIPTGRHWVHKYQLDLLVWPDDIDIAYGGVIGCLTRFGVACGVGWQHAVELCDIEIGICDDRVIWRITLGLLNILGPSLVIARGLDRYSDDLYISAIELWLYFRHVSEFGCAE